MTSEPSALTALIEAVALAGEAAARLRAEIEAERSARRAAEAERDRYLKERDQARATVEYLQAAMPQ